MIINNIRLYLVQNATYNTVANHRHIKQGIRQQNVIVRYGRGTLKVRLISCARRKPPEANESCTQYANLEKCTRIKHPYDGVVRGNFAKNIYSSIQILLLQTQL